MPFWSSCQSTLSTVSAACSAIVHNRFIKTTVSNVIPSVLYGLGSISIAAEVQETLFPREEELSTDWNSPKPWLLLAAATLLVSQDAIFLLYQKIRKQKYHTRHQHADPENQPEPEGEVHHHDEHKHHHNSIIASIITWIGMGLRGALVIVGTRGLLAGLPSGIPLTAGLILGTFRAYGSWYIEGQHTHEEFEKSKEEKAGRCDLRPYLLFVLYAYIFTLIVHLFEYFFEAMAPVNEILDAINQPTIAAQEALIKITTYVVGMMLAAILAFQEMLLEGHHAEEFKDYLKQLPKRDFVIGILPAIFSSVIHVMPAMAGAYIIFEEFFKIIGVEISREILLGTSAAVAVVDVPISLSMHGRYAIEAANWAVNLSNVSHCSRNQGRNNGKVNEKRALI